MSRSSSAGISAELSWSRLPRAILFFFSRATTEFYHTTFDRWPVQGDMVFDMVARMKRDHYIAQTYLKHFGDSNVGGRMHAYRKSGKSSFQPWPADVCADWNDDLNVAFLPHNPEMLGEYRAIFEPMWNPTIEKIASRSPTPEDKFAIAGYLANLMTCTPTWRRVGVEILNDHARGFLYFSKEMKDRYGGNANLPDEAIEMMKAGQIALEHDPDYVKAKVTRRLLDMAWIIFKQNWTVLTGAASQKFVTSDNPSAISYAGPGDLLTRYFP